MTTAQATVTVSMDAKGLTLEALEARIGSALQQAGRELLEQASQVMESVYLQEHTHLRQCKQRPLDLLTRFGWTRLVRWQMRDPEGTYSCPLDAPLEVRPRQHASP